MNVNQIIIFFIRSIFRNLSKTFFVALRLCLKVNRLFLKKEYVITILATSPSLAAQTVVNLAGNSSNFLFTPSINLSTLIAPLDGANSGAGIYVYAFSSGGTNYVFYTWQPDATKAQAQATNLEQIYGVSNVAQLSGTSKYRKVKGAISSNWPSRLNAGMEVYLSVAPSLTNVKAYLYGAASAASGGSATASINFSSMSTVTLIVGGANWGGGGRYVGGSCGGSGTMSPTYAGGLTAILSGNSSLDTNFLSRSLIVAGGAGAGASSSTGGGTSGGNGVILGGSCWGSMATGGTQSSGGVGGNSGGGLSCSSGGAGSSIFGGDGAGCCDGSGNPGGGGFYGGGGGAGFWDSGNDCGGYGSSSGGGGSGYVVASASVSGGVITSGKVTTFPMSSFTNGLYSPNAAGVSVNWGFTENGTNVNSGAPGAILFEVP